MSDEREECMPVQAALEGALVGCVAAVFLPGLIALATMTVAWHALSTSVSCRGDSCLLLSPFPWVGIGLAWLFMLMRAKYGERRFALTSSAIAAVLSSWLMFSHL